MRNTQRGNAAVGLIGLIVIAAVVVGWVMNIAAVFHADFGHITGVLVLRVTGIFVPPLGAVLGYF